MEVYLNKTAHRVVGIAPLERRSKAHGNARGVYEPCNKNVRRCHCADKRIVRDLLCPLDAEGRKPRANKIHVYKHVGLNCEERQNIKLSVIYGAKFFVIFEFVAAKPVYDNQKTEHSENHQNDSDRLVFCEFAFFVHNAPCLSRNDIAKTRDLLSNSPRLFFVYKKISPLDGNLCAYIINQHSFRLSTWILKFFCFLDGSICKIEPESLFFGVRRLLLE